MVAVRRPGEPVRANIIARLAHEHGWTRGAELGVFRGDTFVRLLESGLSMVGVDIWAPKPEMDGIAPGGRSYAAHDLEGYYRTLLKRVEPYGSRATLIRSDTALAAEKFPDGHFDFVFIDADHTAEGVTSDIFAWAPKVRGWILGHDFNPRDFPGVVRVVNEVLPNRRLYGDHVWAVPKSETVFA